MRIFITGATGFAGSHLVDLLLAEGHELFGLVHGETSHQPVRVHPRFQASVGNLLDLADLVAAVQEARPDVIYHLAGQASPSRSWQDPALTLAVNSGGTANILEAARAVGRPRVVVVTSADIYGLVQPKSMPLTEESPPRPHHPYGVSKWAAGQLVPLYWQRYRLPVVEARPFNHIGPRQTLGFAVPDFASQLAAIKLGRREPTVSVGNLDAERDFTDVRDVVRAYRLLAEHGRPGATYLVCSGRAVTIKTVLETLIELSGTEIEVTYDPERIRPSEIPRLVGSYARLAADTGWQPVIDLRQSLADALDDWLLRLAKG
jgi:GDP-4-dehydro-6-deoxy-D-mannose reductase